MQEANKATKFEVKDRQKAKEMKGSVEQDKSQSWWQLVALLNNRDLFIKHFKPSKCRDGDTVHDRSTSFNTSALPQLNAFLKRGKAS